MTTRAIDPSLHVAAWRAIAASALVGSAAIFGAARMLSEVPAALGAVFGLLLPPLLGAVLERQSARRHRSSRRGDALSASATRAARTPFAAMQVAEAAAAAEPADVSEAGAAGEPEPLPPAPPSRPPQPAFDSRPGW